MNSKTFFIAKNNSQLLSKIKQEFADSLVETPGAYAICNRKIIDFMSKNMLGSYPLGNPEMQKSISKKLEEYLSENDYINLTGFENFRLKEEKKQIENIIFYSKMQNEYWDFINLLRYFISIESPKENSIDIFVKENSDYSIINQSNKDVTDVYSEEFEYAKDEGYIGLGDILISVLIRIAPKVLRIHNIGNLKNDDLANTIQHVFAERLLICYGCDDCSED